MKTTSPANHRKYVARRIVSDAYEKVMVADYKAGVPVKEIAKKYTCSESTVVRTMKRYGIPPRNPRACL